MARLEVRDDRLGTKGLIPTVAESIEFGGARGYRAGPYLCGTVTGENERQDRVRTRTHEAWKRASASSHRARSSQPVSRRNSSACTAAKTSRIANVSARWHKPVVSRSREDNARKDMARDWGGGHGRWCQTSAARFPPL